MALQVADSITKFGGFVLIVDYGHDGTRKDLSLRAYKGHQIVHPLENPGEHDITADVNFGYLKSLVKDRTLVFGPVEQRYVTILLFSKFYKKSSLFCLWCC